MKRGILKSRPGSPTSATSSNVSLGEMSKVFTKLVGEFSVLLGFLEEIYFLQTFHSPPSVVHSMLLSLIYSPFQGRKSLPYIFSSGFCRQGSQSDQPVERVSCEHHLDVVGFYSEDVFAMIRHTTSLIDSVILI